MDAEPAHRDDQTRITAARLTVPAFHAGLRFAHNVQEAAGSTTSRPAASRPSLAPPLMLALPPRACTRHGRSGLAIRCPAGTDGGFPDRGPGSMTS